MITQKQIDELREAASKATPWDAHDDTAASEAWKSNKDNNAVFCRRANPSVILALLERLEGLSEALNWIGYAEVNIGNDENGNMRGQPDKVMCRNRARTALAKFGVEKGKQ